MLIETRVGVVHRSTNFSVADMLPLLMGAEEGKNGDVALALSAVPVEKTRECVGHESL